MKHENADIIGIQEIKCAYNKIPSECKLPSYQTFWCSSKKDGYAGVGVYSKTKPINVSKGLNISKHDNEGRVITLEFDQFYFVTACKRIILSLILDVPNSGQGLVRLSYRQKEWDVDFLNYLKKLDTCKPVIVCGDLNVAHEEIGRPFCYLTSFLTSVLLNVDFEVYLVFTL